MKSDLRTIKTLSVFAKNNNIIKGQFFPKWLPKKSDRQAFLKRDIRHKNSRIIREKGGEEDVYLRNRNIP